MKAQGKIGFWTIIRHTWWILAITFCFNAALFLGLHLGLRIDLYVAAFVSALLSGSIYAVALAMFGYIIRDSRRAMHMVFFVQNGIYLMTIFALTAMLHLEWKYLFQ